MKTDDTTKRSELREYIYGYRSYNRLEEETVLNIEKIMTEIDKRRIDLSNNNEFLDILGIRELMEYDIRLIYSGARRKLEKQSDVRQREVVNQRIATLIALVQSESLTGVVSNNQLEKIKISDKEINEIAEGYKLLYKIKKMMGK